MMSSISEQYSANLNKNIWLFTLLFDTPVAGEFDSTKIYGALLFAMKQLYPKEFNEFYEGIKNGEIRISSPFPVKGREIFVFKPILKLSDEISSECQKKFKRVEYVPVKTAKKALEHGMFNSELVHEVINNGITNKMKEIPKVSTSRLGGKTQIYYLEEKYMQETGILVIAGKFEKEVNSCLRYIGEIGISKKSSWGLGFFKVVNKVEFTNRISSNGLFYLISRYAPDEEDIHKIKFSESYYNLRRIVGRTRAGISFQQRVLVEGSVLRISNYPPTGKVIEINDRTYPYSACFVPMFV